MTKSAEFPEYDFVKPRSYQTGRNGSVTYVVLHTTEGAANSSAARNGASYDSSRTDFVSTHFFVDNQTTVQCVYTWDTAYTARAANTKGIQIEMCGRAATSNWTGDGYYKALLENAAKLTAKLCKKYGMPARFLTDSELRAGNVKGLTTHRQVTKVLGGTHTDPGPNFPYDYFIGRVKAYLDPVSETKPVVQSPVAAGATPAQASPAAIAAKTLMPGVNKNMYLVQLKGKSEVYLSNLIVRRHVKSPAELAKLEQLLGIEKEIVPSLAPYGIEVK